MEPLLSHPPQPPPHSLQGEATVPPWALSSGGWASPRTCAHACAHTRTLCSALSRPCFEGWGGMHGVKLVHADLHFCVCVQVCVFVYVCRCACRCAGARACMCRCECMCAYVCKPGGCSRSRGGCRTSLLTPPTMQRGAKPTGFGHL